MRRCLSHVSLFLFTALAILGSPASAQDRTLQVGQTAARESRIALLIGNGSYKESPLANPVNDASDMAVVLAGLGFEVLLRENINQREMKQAIREFGDRIRTGGVGLFYFAGHGVQVKGRNFLIPVGSDIQREDEVEDESIDVNLVLEKMEAAGNRLNIVVLDACRNNPFQRSFRSASRGLAPLDAAKGTLVAFATGPGAVAADGNGRNGVYTRHLLASLRHPESDIEKVFRRVRAGVLEETRGQQVPWETSSLTGDFFFNSRQTASSAPATAAVQADTPLAIEIAYWQSIQSGKDASNFENYLRRYPTGQFTEIAVNRIKELTGSRQGETSPTIATPPAGASRIYFLRRSSLASSLVSWQISQANRTIGELANSSYFEFRPGAGEQAFSAHVAGGINSITRTYKIEAGKTYYIELELTFGKGSLALIPEEQGASYIRSLRNMTQSGVR